MSCVVLKEESKLYELKGKNEFIGPNESKLSDEGLHLNSKMDNPKGDYSKIDSSKNVEAAILEEFKLKKGETALEDCPVLLFQIFTNYIVSQRYYYNMWKKEPIKILESSHGVMLEVNCFDLSKAFLLLIQKIGISDASTRKYAVRMGRKLKCKYSGIEGEFTCFDARMEKFFFDRGNVFCFDWHCVVRVKNTYFDPTLLCYYKDDPYIIFDPSPAAQICNAVLRKNIDGLKELIQKHGDEFIHYRPFFGFTLLHLAAHKKDFPTIRFLLKKKINAQLKNNEGVLAIELLDDPDSDEFRLVKKHTNAVDVKNYIQRLEQGNLNDAIQAIKKGNLKAFIEAMLKKIDLNSKNSEGQSLLHLAVIEGRLDIVKFLLKHKARTNILNRERLAPIQLLKSITSPMYKLLRPCTDIEIIGEHAVHVVETLRAEAMKAIKEEDSKLLDECLENGLPINRKDSSGRTLLQWAEIFGKSNIAEYLVKRGAEPSKDRQPNQFKQRSQQGETVQKLPPITFSITKCALKVITSSEKRICFPELVLMKL